MNGFPPTVQDIASSMYRATNKTYGTAATSGSYSDCAVTFAAPMTGRVLIHWSGVARNIHRAGLAVAYISPEVREGDTIGSGDVILDAADTRSVRTNLSGRTTVRAGTSHLLVGLAPGDSYHARLLHRVTSQTGEFLQRGIIVAPAT